MRRFEDRVALVTGAASGIGRATAQRLASEGAAVFCADVDEAGLADTLAKIGAARGRSASRIVDVADPAAARGAVAAAVDRFGGLDVLCNIAGVGSFQHTSDVTPEEWQRVVGINLSGTFYMSQAALPHLLERRGNIVNLASTAGLIGQAYNAAYCASKGGVVLLTKSLGVEFARHGLRVNCLCPGGVDTPFTKAFGVPEGADVELIGRLTLVRKLASPEDIAAAVAFIASDEARFINAAALPVDAGMTAS
jgi:meso-butanediol dehydrogenase / (S,S)-butanediol dehydrogenase / diacetyl reductase